MDENKGGRMMEKELLQIMEMENENKKMRKLLEEIFNSDDNQSIDPADRCDLSWWAYDKIKEILEGEQ